MKDYCLRRYLMKDCYLSREEESSIIKNIEKAKTKKFILQNGMEVYVKETCFIFIDGVAVIAYPSLNSEGKWGFYYYCINKTTGEQDFSMI